MEIWFCGEQPDKKKGRVWGGTAPDFSQKIILHPLKTKKKLPANKIIDKKIPIPPRPMLKL